MIESTFKRSPKIWGTYNLVSEKTRHKSINQKQIKGSLDVPIADVVLNKESMVFIRPISSKGKTEYKVNSLPYIKKKGNQYLLNIDHKSDLLFQVYRDQIRKLLNLSAKNGPIEEKNIIFEKFSCTKKKGRINCVLPILVNGI